MKNSTPKVRGFWKWTWSHGKIPNDATLSIAFSGWSDIKTALSSSKHTKAGLIGERYVSVGGGNKNGAFDQNAIEKIIVSMDKGEFEGYQGMAFDIEECDSGLSNGFKRAFEAAKNHGLKVLVTVSHAAPFGCKDAEVLMRFFFRDENIDYLSPQLYTTGKESENDFTTNPSINVSWKDYASARAAIIPSIVKADYYQNAADYFTERGVSIAGYIQWQQTQ